MATTFTPNFHFGLQLDHSDKYDHKVITDNTQSLDTILYGKQDNLTFDGTYDASTNPAATVATVTNAIADLPKPIIFKGSLGVDGTITSLPTAAEENEGFEYKVITAGTYDSQAADIGDLFISTGTEWVRIPSGDEPGGTVTSVAVTAGAGLTVSGSPITTSGNITVGHSNSITARTAEAFGQMRFDSEGHITYFSPATVAQTDALNSGIDSTKVSQIATNTSNISNINTTLSGKVDTAGAGLSKNGTTLAHSNSITPRVAPTFAQVAYDSEGHITATTAATVAQTDAINSGITAAILAQLQPTISSNTIDNTALATFFSGTMCGLLDTTITGESTAIYGIVRAYTVATNTAIQIAEDFNGGRNYRTYTSSTWSNWAVSPIPITDQQIDNLYEGGE